MAEDIPIDLNIMSAWTREQVAAYFESGGEQRPGMAAEVALSGLHTFSGKLIDGRSAAVSLTPTGSTCSLALTSAPLCASQ